MRNRSRAVRLGVFVVLAAAALAALTATASSQRAALRHGAMTPAIVSGGPQYQYVGPATSPTVPFGCQTRPPAAFPASSCYGPDQIRKAYGIQTLLDHGINGSGRSITIIDAYGSPTIATELKTFDATFNIPDPTLNIIAPDGIAPTTPDNAFGWAVETALDVEWAHAVAPNATINLVEARSNNDADILSATKYVMQHRVGDVISQSFGEAEQCMDPALLQQQNRIFARMADQGQTLLASAGDDGAANADCTTGETLIKSTSTPATDPNVTAVGGTALNASPAVRDPATLATIDPGGNYIGETVWWEYDKFGDRTSTGGGVSSVYSEPFYQRLAPPLRRERMRWIPDIAYNAAIQGGVLTAAFFPASVGGTDSIVFFRVGGTSAGSPQWAGLTALAAQVAHGRVGNLNPVLYALGASPFASAFFHDVTVGNNTVPAAFTGTGSDIVGYSAAPGWDATTGWGSPRADRLVPALAAGRLFHGGDR